MNIVEQINVMLVFETFQKTPVWVAWAVMVGLVLFLLGLPIPVGFDRGKVAFLQWCGTGMHAHIVYYDGGRDGAGFQTLHPADAEGGGA